MNSSQRANEITLDFSCVLWDFISQWKAVFVFSLIVSILVTGFKYSQDSDAYELAVEAANETIASIDAPRRIQETLDALSDDDRAAVEYALQFRRMLSDKRAYQAESPIMSLDSNHTEVVSLCFRVESMSDSSLRSSLSDGYISLFNDASALETISEATTSKIKPDFLKELLSFSDPYSALSYAPDGILKDDDTFNIFVIIPPGESADAISDAVSDVIRSRCSELSKTITPHTVRMISKTSSTTVCSSVLAKQSDVYYSISYLSGNLNVTISEMNAQQSAAYNSILQLQSVVLNPEAANAVAEAAIPDKPAFSKRSMILGLGLGAIVYFFALILYTLLHENVLSSKIAAKVLHKRLIGECYVLRHEDTFLRKMFQSPAIFNYRYRDKTDPDKQSEVIAQSLEIVSAKEPLGKISLINTSDVQESFSELVLSACKENGLSLELVDCSRKAAAYTLKGINNALISVNRNTSIKQLYSLIDLLDYYKIEILGFIYTADR